MKKDDPLQLKVKEPSQAFLKEDIYDPAGHDLPEELVYMIHGIRVLGFFEKPLFLKMCQKIEEMNVMKGEFLFNIGDPDDSIYIVKNGEIKVTLNEPDGSILLLKNVSVHYNLDLIIQCYSIQINQYRLYNKIHDEKSSIIDQQQTTTTKVIEMIHLLFP